MKEGKELVESIFRVTDAIEELKNKQLGGYGITSSQEKVMRFIYRDSNLTTQKDIERGMKVSHPTIVGIVARLEKAGMVIHHRDLNDRRNKIVELTEEGKKVCAAIDKYVSELGASLRNVLSDDEAKAVISHMDTITDYLS